MNTSNLNMQAEACALLEAKTTDGLPIDTNPSKEKLLHICELRDSESEEDRNEASILILGCTAPLIAGIIKTKFSAYMSKHLDDLITEGYAAVLDAFTKYNPNESSLNAYFSRFINHSLTQYVCAIQHCTPHIHSAVGEIKKAVKEMAANGENITIENICEKTGLARRTVERSVRVIIRNAAESAGA